MNGPIFSTYRDLPSSNSVVHEDSFYSRLPDLSNSSNLSFFGTSGDFSLFSGTGILPSKSVAENAEGSVASDTATTDVPPGYSELDPLDVLPEEAEIATGELEGEEIASEAAPPLGLALMANSALGQAVNSGMTSATNTQINNDYIQNMQQHGLNVGLDASLIRSSQMETSNRQDVGGSIGSLFGPLGALIGHSIAGVVSANPNLLFNSGSFQGAINSSDPNVVASQSTQNLSGNSDLVDNVTGN